MTIERVSNIIRKHNYIFEILIDEKIFDKKSEKEAIAESGSLENYLRNMASLNNDRQMGVQVYAKNGSVLSRKNFFFAELEPFEKIKRPFDSPIDGVQEPFDSPFDSQKMPFDQPFDLPIDRATKWQKEQKNTIQTPSQAMDTKAEILEVRLEFANKRVQELEERSKNLEQRNNELFNENNKLLRDNLTQKDKLELEFKEKKLELENEKQSGLSGIMENVNSMSPEAWQFIAGIFPNHPMNKGLNGNKEEDKKKLRHSDDDMQLCIDTMNETLINQPAEIVGMITMLSQAFINNPSALQRVYFKFYPKEAPKEKVEQTQTENL